MLRSSMTFLIFIVASLVVYRLSLMTVLESGPARIFRKLRNIPPPKSATKEGLTCLHCSSIYHSSYVTAYLWWLEYIPAWETPIYWLAFSASAIILHHQWTENFKK